MLMLHEHEPGAWDFARELEARGVPLDAIPLRADVDPIAFLQLTGYLTRIDFTNRAKNLRAYELTWSPVTHSEKTNRFAFDSRLDRKRASLNRRMKSELLNDGFGDAVLYLNEKFRAKIQAPVTNAIFSILDDDFLPADQFIIITHSLGSKLTFDSLNRLVKTVEVSISFR